MEKKRRRLELLEKENLRDAKKRNKEFLEKNILDSIENVFGGLNDDQTLEDKACYLCDLKFGLAKKKNKES